MASYVIYFFFLAEDGIRFRTVTGVQTCALPIYHDLLTAPLRCAAGKRASLMVAAPLLLGAVELDELLADGIEHGLHARVQVKLLEDVADVVLDGVLGDPESAADLPVRQAVGGELEHLELAVGERRTQRAFVGPLADRRELAHELRGDGRREQRVSGVRLPDTSRDLRRVDLLEQVTRRTGLDRFD